MNINIGDIIYEDFEGNNQLPAGVYKSKITRIDNKGVYSSNSKEYPDEELSFPYKEYGIWWFTSENELYENRLLKTDK